MPSIDVERIFISHSASDRTRVRMLKWMMLHHYKPLQPPGDAAPIEFGPLFDETVETLHALVEGAQACSTPEMLARHLELSIESLSLIARRRVWH